MRKINLKVIYAAMAECCKGYDSITVTCSQANGVLLQWEWSNDGEPVNFTIGGFTLPEVNRMSDKLLNSQLLLLIKDVKSRVMRCTPS